MRMELTAGVLVALAGCGCSPPPPTPASRATPAPAAPPRLSTNAPRPAATAPNPPPAASAARAPISPTACFEPTPPRHPLEKEVGPLERVARDTSAPRDDRARAAYDAAVVYHHAEDWSRAAQLFRIAALDGTSDVELHGFAMQMYLEALNLLATRRRACDAVFHTDVESLLGRYCTNAPAKLTETCVILRRVRFSLLRSDAQRAVEVADTSGDPADMKRGAALLRSLFERECMAADQTLRKDCVEVGFNAGHVLLATGDEAGARKVLAQLRDPKRHFFAPQLVRQLECEISGKPPEDCDQAQAGRKAR
jgi:hypothetical protein